MSKAITPNPATETPEATRARQLAIITHRIETVVGYRNMVQHQPLRAVLDKERYDRVVQMLWDEYQFKPEPIDSIKDIAYILQKRINP